MGAAVVAEGFFFEAGAVAFFAATLDCFDRTGFATPRFEGLETGFFPDAFAVAVGFFAGGYFAAARPVFLTGFLTGALALAIGFLIGGLALATGFFADGLALGTGFFVAFGWALALVLANGFAVVFLGAGFFTALAAGRAFAVALAGFFAAAFFVLLVLAAGLATGFFAVAPGRLDVFLGADFADLAAALFLGCEAMLMILRAGFLRNNRARVAVSNRTTQAPRVPVCITFPVHGKPEVVECADVE